MALQFGPLLEINFVDKRLAAGQTTTSSIGTPANYASEATLDTRLAAISGTTYTAARLRQMSTNDKIYALRLSDDSGSV